MEIKLNDNILLDYNITGIWKHRYNFLVSNDNDRLDFEIFLEEQGSVPEAMWMLRKQRIDENLPRRREFAMKYRRNKKEALEMLMQEPVDNCEIEVLDGHTAYWIYDTFLEDMSHTVHSLANYFKFANCKDDYLTMFEDRA
ncbi:hypothetical protein [Radiobacillus sp. PE A8.2]|uniref:hypothetical protein n=1 Tax=Radiobacillus sp. PE A8.2 TaxID=3380349 RepID=UPI00388F0C1C